jgi:hypothetical protein
MTFLLILQASPLAAEVAVSLNVHRSAVVRGVRWLGASHRLVSFTVERVQVGFGMGCMLNGECVMSDGLFYLFNKRRYLSYGFSFMSEKVKPLGAKQTFA